MHRFYISDIADSDKTVSITGSDVNHIINVLRLKIGDEITISNGSSRDYLCKISYLDKNDLTEVKADIIDIFDSNAELPAEIYLFQGVPKGDKMELIIQKNVELGVHEIIPVMMDRTVVKLDDKKKGKKQERYQAISEAASKQSRRGIIPKVNEYMTFNKALEYAKGFSDFVLVPYESAEGMDYSRKVLEDISALVKEKVLDGDKLKVSVFIGPEGGFSQSEIDLMKENDAAILSLGHRILRTETAGMAVLSVLSFMIDE